MKMKHAASNATWRIAGCRICISFSSSSAHAIATCKFSLVSTLVGALGEEIVEGGLRDGLPVQNTAKTTEKQVHCVFLLMAVAMEGADVFKLAMKPDGRPTSAHAQ